MKTLSCLLMLGMAMMIFLTFSNVSVAEEGDTITISEDEVVQQTPAPAYLTEEDTDDTESIEAE